MTAFSIIFFFAGRPFLNKLDLYSPVTTQGGGYPWWVRWSGVGGTFVNRIELRVLNQDEVLDSSPYFKQSAEKVLQSYEGRALLFLSVERVREDLLKQSWVSQADVRKTFPDRLEVRVSVRRPVFVLRGGDSWILASSDGSLISASPFLSGRWSHLPQVFGLEDRLRGDVESMSRRMVEERPWLKDLAGLLVELRDRVRLEVLRVKIRPDAWAGSAVFELDHHHGSLKLLSGAWSSRLAYLQYILSDLKKENAEFEAKIDGRYPAKWYVAPQKGEL